MTATEELELIRSLRGKVTALTMRNELLTGYRETQAEVIKGYQVRVVAAEKRCEKLQDMNDHAQAHIAKLERQLSPIGQAERHFK
jgi:hypothetical protein